MEVLINPPQEVFDQMIEQTTATEGWPHQFTDYTHWRTSFDNFWFFSVVEKGTLNLVASVTLARWDGEEENEKTSLFSIGMYYTSQKFRKNGHATQIFKMAMEQIGDHNAVLFGAPEMSPKYAKIHGFDKMADFWHYSSVFPIDSLKFPEISENSRKFSVKNFPEISQHQFETFDLSICCKNRWKIMNSRFEMPNSFTKFIVDEQKNTVVGYGSLRIVHGAKLQMAPFYADDLEIATVLLSNLLKSVPSLENFPKIAFMHPENNENALKLLSKFSSNVTSTKADRLQFTKKYLKFPSEKVYAVTDVTHQFV